MKTFYWLVKREFWEHRGSFLWTPVITASVVLAINILAVIASEVVGNRNFFLDAVFWQKVATASPDDLRQIGTALDFGALMPIFIINIVLFFVLFSYCMKSLSSDRKDRSILFWKSLPVSDLSTVLSKAFSAIVVAPVIATVVGIVGAIGMYLILAITGAFHGVGFGEAMWSLPHPGHIILAIAGTLPIFMVWMLPCVGWLMLCSAWSSGKVARWAIALPFGAGAIISWMNVMGSAFSWGSWYWTHVALRIVLGVFPGSWLIFGDYRGMGILLGAREDSTGWETRSNIHSFANMLVDNLGRQYHFLLTPDFLWGALAGLVMIAAAIWLRRWRTEL